MKIKYSKAWMVLAIFICVLYFLVGGVAVWFKFFTKDDYLTIGGVVGGLASVVGLISLTRPAITSDDLQQVELSTLEKLTRASKEIENLEVAKQKTRAEVSSLELRRQELEVLVRKASLALFLKEQLSYHEKQVLEKVSKDSSLSESIEQIREVQLKLNKLEEEIKLDPNVEILRQVIEDAGASGDELKKVIRNVESPFIKMMVELIEVVTQSFVRIVKP